MNLLAQLAARLRSLFRHGREDAETQDELRIHLEMETQKNLRAGMDPREARRQAHVRLGGVDAIREAVRDAHGTRPVEDLLRDLGYALRVARRSPGFTAAAVVPLAIPIGFNSTVFTIVDSFLLRPLEVVRPAQLVDVYTSDPNVGRYSTSSYPDSWICAQGRGSPSSPRKKSTKRGSQSPGGPLPGGVITWAGPVFQADSLDYTAESWPGRCLELDPAGRRDPAGTRGPKRRRGMTGAFHEGETTMSSTTRIVVVAALAAVAAIAAFGPEVLQAQTYSNNPYRPVPWPKPWQPDGLNGSIDFGATTGMYADPNTDHLWLATRCGRTPRYHTNQEGCVFKPDYDMVFKFDLDGNLVARFGAGTLGKPHSLFVDSEGNVWVADFAGGAEYGHTATEVEEEMRQRGLGHQVVKFSPDGEVLMRLGTPGVPGGDDTHFRNPSAVAVALDGSVFVGDGHGGNGNNRLIKFAADGTFIKQIGCSDCPSGQTGNTAWGEVKDAHALDFDAEGRLFVADKLNGRIQIFDQELNLLDVWTQFGAPAGLAIDRASGLLVTADAESHNSPPLDGSPGNAGWEQGLYVGSARTGWVTSFILAAAPPITGGDGGPEGVAVDRYGNIYWGETRSALDIMRGQHIMKFVDITRTPHATCEWWGYESEREGRGVVGCGIDRESRNDR